MIKKYAPKNAQGKIEAIDKDYDGYDIMLKDGFKFSDTDTTIRIEPTVAEMKKSFKYIVKSDDSDDGKISDAMDNRIKAYINSRSI